MMGQDLVHPYVQSTTVLCDSIDGFVIVCFNTTYIITCACFLRFGSKTNFLVVKRTASGVEEDGSTGQ